MRTAIHHAIDSPRVSILLPVHNGERFLPAAVDSISRQTLRNIEIIIVDDGSTDSSPLIVDRLASKDSRIRVLRRQACGISSALEAARRIARAPYIARMDCDDIALPHRLAAQVKYLDCRTSCVAVGGQVEVINESEIGRAHV